MHSAQSQVSIPVMVGDTGRTLRINLSDGSNPYVIADGCLAKISIKRPTGTRLEDFCTIEGNTTIVYPFGENTCAVEGIHDCDVTLYGLDGNVITSPRFSMVISERVVKSDDIVVADEDMTAVDAMVVAEASRQNAEAAREAIEAERVKSEAERNAKETERQAAEAERSATFNANEAERIAAFEANEAERSAAFEVNEAERNAKEAERKASESEREEKEAERAVREADRAANEEARVANEEARVANEVARQANAEAFGAMQAMVANHTKDIEDLKQTVGNGVSYELTESDKLAIAEVVVDLLPIYDGGVAR